MLDSLIYDSLDLDFKIYQAVNTKFKNYKNEIENPKLKSDDIFKEFENHIETSSKIFHELNELLTECNVQRENMRTILIKMSKDKMLVQKFFKDDDNCLILSKLQLHDELKSFVNDRNIDTITNMNKRISNLQTQLAFYKMEFIENSSNTTLYSNYNLSNGNLNYKKTSATKNNSKLKSETKVIKSKVNTGLKNPNGKVNSNENKNSHIQDSKTKTKSDYNKNDFKSLDLPLEIYSKNMVNLNLDFNSEKYNIISSSPIMTPKENKTKQITNFNSIIGKLNNSINTTITNNTTNTNNTLITNSHSNKPSDQKDGSKTERETSKVYCSNYVELERPMSISRNLNKGNNHNFISEANLRKHNDNKNDPAKENGKSVKSYEYRNSETKLNFANYSYQSNFSIVKNSNNSSDKNQTRKQMLSALSRSIDFEENFTENKKFKNDVYLTSDDPIPDTLLSYKNSVNQTPNAGNRQDYSLLTNDLLFMLNEDKDKEEKRKNSEVSKIKRKKRNSMSELIFSNFLSKYNILNSYSRKDSVIKEETDNNSNTKNPKDTEKAAMKLQTIYKPLNKKNSMMNVYSNLSQKNKNKSIMNMSYGDAASPSMLNNLASNNTTLTVSNQKNKNSIKSFNSGYKEGKNLSKI